MFQRSRSNLFARKKCKSSDSRRSFCVYLRRLANFPRGKILKRSLNAYVRVYTRDRVCIQNVTEVRCISFHLQIL